MSKELDSIVEEFANKLLKALKGTVDQSPSDKSKSKDGDETSTASQSKISVGSSKDPAQKAQELEQMGEELRLQLQLNEAQADFFEMKESAFALLDHEKKIKESLAAAINDENVEAEKALQIELQKMQSILGPYRKFIKGKQKASKLNKEMKRTSDAYFDSLSSKLGLTTKLQDTYVGKFMNFSKLLSAEGGGATFFASLGTAMLNLPLSVLDSIVNTTIDMIVGFDKATASFAGATGFADKYSKQIMHGAIANTRLGISADDMSKGMQAVTSVMSDTSTTSKATVEALAATAAQLDKIGVAMEDTARAMLLFVNVGGMMKEEAMDMTKEIFQMGSAIDVTAQKMSKDFVMSMKTLSVYGTSKAKDMFVKLTAAAHASGTEMSTLLGIAGQFDTFQSAAETVGKLNAILGTQMSTTEMIQMTEEQRIETVIQQIQMSGRSFKDLDRYTQKAVAASVGITDMAQANLVFGMSMRKYQKYQEDMKKSEASQKTLNDAIKKAQPVMDKLKIAFMELFAANEDFIMSIKDGTEAVVDFIKEHKENIKIGIMVYAGLRVGIPLLRTIGLLYRGGAAFINLFRSAMVKEAVQQQTNNLIKAETVIINKSVGTSSRFAASGIVAIGAALGLAFIGIGVMVKSVASLAESLKGMSSEEVRGLKDLLVNIGLGLGVFSVAIVIAGSSATASALGIGIISAAVFAAGAAIGMASAGIGVMAEGMAKLAEQGYEGAVGIATSGLAIAGLAAALTFILPTATPAIVVLGVFGAAILLVGVGVNLMARALDISIGALKGVGAVADGTGAIIRDLALGFFMLAGAAAILGSPPAVIGAGFIYGFMALAATATIANAAIATSSADAAKDIAKIAEDLEVTKLEKVTGAINGIADAVRNVDGALGRGARRLEVLSVFSDLAAISTSESGTTRPVSTVTAASAQYTSNARSNLNRGGQAPIDNTAQAIMELVKVIKRTPLGGKEKFDLELYVDGAKLAVVLDSHLDGLKRQK